MEKEKEIELTEEERNAWYELWKFANASISYGDGLIGYTDFVKEGSAQFELKIKST